MTVVFDRNPVASGAWSQPEPPPALPSVDDAQRFYLSGPADLYLSGPADLYSMFACAGQPWSFAPGPVYIIEPGHFSSLLGSVAGEVTRLRQLRHGWDGYRAKPITERALYSVGRVLSFVLRPDSEPPQFAPLIDGGIQIEWLVGGDDLTIEVRDTGEVNVLAMSASGETIAEGSMDLDQPGDLAARAASFLQVLSAQVAAERLQT
jgi:hypothetical protein